MKHDKPRYCRDCVSYPANGKKRGDCVMKGQIVHGGSSDRPCWQERKKKMEIQKGR